MRLGITAGLRLTGTATGRSTTSPNCSAISTSQPPNENKNGYLALAVFDDPANGGNDNGVIDPGDSVYDHLLLWIDANHSGVSEPDELHSLRDVGVFRIDLKYHESKHTDANGNQFRYEAPVWEKTSVLPRKSYDVFLTVETEQ